MDNQLRKISLVLPVLFLLSIGLFGQNSLPMALDETEYTSAQKTMINKLLTSTQSILTDKLTRSSDDEYISKVIITNSYKFARGYSEIMDEDSVPFKLVTSSTSFLGCWVSDNFISTAGCWDEHLSKASGAKFSSLK